MKLREILTTQIVRHVHEIVEKENPETVESLIILVQEKYGLSRKEIMDIVCRAELHFTTHPTRSSDFQDYVFSANARWYWFTISLSVLTAAIVLVLPEISPIVYFRFLLGSVFVLWMPGYVFVKSLFPQKKLEELERIALSLGTSVALVPMSVLVLHYTPWGIRTGSVITMLLILTLVFSTLAIYREREVSAISGKRAAEHSAKARNTEAIQA